MIKLILLLFLISINVFAKDDEDKTKKKTEKKPKCCKVKSESTKSCATMTVLDTIKIAPVDQVGGCKKTQKSCCKSKQ